MTRTAFPPPALIENIQAVKAGLRRCEEEGGRCGPELLASLPYRWRERMREDPHLRSYGTLEYLLNAARAKFESQPTMAKEITSAVVDFVEQVSDAPHASYHISLRGKAWKEHANALHVAGYVTDALAAAKRAIAIYGESPGLHFQQTRARLVLATIHRDIGNMNEAFAIARECALTFKDYGCSPYVTMARMIEGCTLFKLKRHAEALAIFADLMEQAERDGDAETLARGLTNAAECARELGDLPAALDLYPRALAQWSRLNAPTESNRARWGHALTLAAEGRRGAAMFVLYSVRDAFLKIGANSGAASAMLDVVRIRFETGDDVQNLCAELVTTFATQGLTQNALEALAYLREQAVAGELSAVKINSVQEYMEELPRSPFLVFCRPRD